MRAVAARAVLALACLLLLQAEAALEPRLKALIQQNVSASNNAYQQLVQQAPPAQLWIQVRSAAQAQLIKDHIAAFKALQWRGRPISIEPLQVVPDGPPVSQLRYFRAEDRPAIGDLRAALADAIPSLQIKDFSAAYRQVSWLHSGHLELWLAPDVTRLGGANGHSP